jgi:hypothetical protein
VPRCGARVCGVVAPGGAACRACVRVYARVCAQYVSLVGMFCAMTMLGFAIFIFKSQSMGWVFAAYALGGMVRAEGAARVASSASSYRATVASHSLARTRVGFCVTVCAGVSVPVCLGCAFVCVHRRPWARLRAIC